MSPRAVASSELQATSPKREARMPFTLRGPGQRHLTPPSHRQTIPASCSEGQAAPSSRLSLG